MPSDRPHRPLCPLRGDPMKLRSHDYVDPPTIQDAYRNWAVINTSHCGRVLTAKGGGFTCPTCGATRAAKLQNRDAVRRLVSWILRKVVVA